jgi:hypothetical protein
MLAFRSACIQKSSEGARSHQKCCRSLQKCSRSHQSMPRSHQKAPAFFHGSGCNFNSTNHLRNFSHRLHGNKTSLSENQRCRESGYQVIRFCYGPHIQFLKSFEDRRHDESWTPNERRTYSLPTLARTCAPDAKFGLKFVDRKFVSAGSAVSKNFFRFFRNCVKKLARPVLSRHNASR